MARIGQIIDGKFRILKPIGRGGMSRVYLAQDTHLGKKWVVKEIPKFVNGGKNTLFIHAALSEAEIIKSLDHPCIVRIVDISQDARAVYIVEDFVEGRSLKEIADNVDAIEPFELRTWAIQLCQVLIYLHSRKPAVIYRDLKPENIILTESGHIKLVDFGIARRYRPDGDRDTVYLGTVQFAAPEQYEEYGSQTDMRTDIYGFGKTLEYLSYYCPKLSETVFVLIEKCIREDPNERFQNAETLLQALFAIRDFSRTVIKRKTVLRILLALSSGIILFYAGVSNFRKSDTDQLAMLRNQMKTIREDGIFSLQEEEQLLNNIMPYLSELKEKEGFQETAFEVGQLYLDCYEYGSGSLKGVEEAVSWFELAGDENETAGICRMIGRYQAATKGMDPLAAPEGAYLDQMENLTQLTAQAAASNISGDLKAVVCQIAADALTANIYQFKKDGVSLRDVELLMTHISRMISELRNLEEEKEKKDQIDELLQKRLDLAKQAVSLAFS